MYRKHRGLLVLEQLRHPLSLKAYFVYLIHLLRSGASMKGSGDKDVSKIEN